MQPLFKLLNSLSKPQLSLEKLWKLKIALLVNSQHFHSWLKSRLESKQPGTLDKLLKSQALSSNAAQTSLMTLENAKMPSNSSVVIPIKSRKMVLIAPLRVSQLLLSAGNSLTVLDASLANRDCLRQRVRKQARRRITRKLILLLLNRTAILLLLNRVPLLLLLTKSLVQAKFSQRQWMIINHFKPSILKMMPLSRIPTMILLKNGLVSLDHPFKLKSFLILHILSSNFFFS